MKKVLRQLRPSLDPRLLAIYPTITPISKGRGQALGNESGFVFLLGQVINFIFYILGGIALVFILFGAIRYITAGGSPDGLEKAKKTFLYAVVGLVIVLLSYFIVQLIENAAGLPGGNFAS